MSKNSKYRIRRISALVAALVGVAICLILNPASYETEVVLDQSASENTATSSDDPLAIDVLAKIEIKGRAPKTGYSREEFYKTWPTMEDGCNLRQKIIKRDFGDSTKLDGCTVIAGEYNEPYTGEHIVFSDKATISKQVQIDHVVALSDTWQKGSQYMSKETRYAMATDPLNLLAVDSSANQQKSDGDAATWLPSNKAFRCQYVARQISVKYKYNLWVTEAEHDAMIRVLETCPNERSTGVKL